MSIQWVLVCSQDAAPKLIAASPVSGAYMDCSNGTLAVMNYSFSSGIEAFGSLLSMSASDASVVSFAVIGVWAIAWGFKQAIRSLGSSKNEDE